MRYLKISVILAFLTVVSNTFAEWQSFTVFNSPLPTNYLISLAVDCDNRVMVGTQGRGLVLKSGGQWRNYDQNSTGVPINYPLHTLSVGDTLFVGTASGNLDQFAFGEGMSILGVSDSTWRRSNAGIEISPIVTGVISTPAYRAVSTYGGGITLFDSQGWVRYQAQYRTEFSYADSQVQTFKVPIGTYLPTDYIKAIDYDASRNILWLATLDGGAVAFDGTVWQNYHTGNSGLPSNRVQLIKINHLNGKVYFGSFGFGLTEKDGANWTCYTSANSPLVADYIYSMEIRPDNGDLWIGTNYGISVLSDSLRWRSYLPGDSGLVWGDFYSDFAFDSIGNVWVATFGGGMACKRIVIPDEPEDTLVLNVNRLKFFLRSPRRSDITWLDTAIEPAVPLDDSDSVSVTISSDHGEVYRWQRTFAPFSRIFHWNGTDIYLAAVDGSLMLLRYRHNLDRINMYLVDWRGPVNRDNMQSWLDVRIRLAGFVGHELVAVGQADPTADADADTIAHEPDDLFLSSEFGPVITGLDDDDFPIVPDELTVQAIYPNPFNSRTTFSFELIRPAEVSLEIFDPLGRLAFSNTVHLEAGRQILGWNAAGAASGVYYYRLSAGGIQRVGRMTLVK